MTYEYHLHLENTFHNSNMIMDAQGTKTLNYASLDDLCIKDEKHVVLKNDVHFKDNLLKEIKKIMNQNTNPYACFLPSRLQEIYDDLLTEGYIVYNRVDKYYVFAFALDGARFPVYSKDCEPELINWSDDQNGEVAIPLD